MKLLGKRMQNHGRRITLSGGVVMEYHVTWDGTMRWKYMKLVGEIMAIIINNNILR